MGEDVLVTCSFCEKDYTQKENYRTVVRDMERGVVEFRLVCPYCKSSTHIFFLDRELRKKQADLNAQRDRLRRVGVAFQDTFNYQTIEYQRLFDELNIKYRKEFRINKDAQRNKNEPERSRTLAGSN